MRREVIPGRDLTIRWRDEREGRALLRNADDLVAVLEKYGFGPVLATPPLIVEDNDFILTCQADGGYPCLLHVKRKAKGKVQAAAWRFARETRMARIEYQDDELGVHFLDEDRFVPFDKLSYDANGGFTLG